MLLQYVSLAPDILFGSSVFPLAFRAAMTGLTVVHTDIIFAALDFFRVVVTHDCLEPQAASSPKFSIYAAAINDAVNANGSTLVACILNGLVGDFPEEAMPTIVSIFRMFAYIWPTQLLAWLPQALEQLPLQSGPIQAKTQFLSDVST
jgi:transportin-3